MAKTIDATWTSAEKWRIESLSPWQLFDEMMDLASGDDYDGCFTDRGAFTFAHLKQAFEKLMESHYGPQFST